MQRHQQDPSSPPEQRPGTRAQQAATASPTRRAVAIDGNKIWVSEPVAIALICALLVPLIYITANIIRNEYDIHEADRELAALKAEKVNTTHTLETMREQHRIVNLLKAVVGPRIKPETVYKLADLVYINSRQYGYKPELLLAVIAVESRFDPEALGRYRSGTLSGALGLMQVKYPTALDMAKIVGIEGLQPEDLLDPEINMILGTAYLTMLISRFKSLKLGIMAYNLGPGTVRGTLARNEELPIQYYEKILWQYYRLKELGAKMEAEAEGGT